MDVITFNDALEHFVDPVTALKAANGILKRDGILVVEVPDMGCADAVRQQAAFKHVKPHEHLWYFTSNQIRDFLEVNGFIVVGMDVPIPGKVTAYAMPVATVNEIEILGPPGVGDIVWTLHKLKGIREREAPCRVKYVICCDGDHKIVTRAKDFLGLCKHIDSIEFRPVPLPADTGCANPAEPVYSFLANDHFDPKQAPFKGKLIEDWHPQLSDEDWDIGVEVPACALEQARLRTRKAGKYVTVYMSSHVWNRIVTEPLWTTKHWAELFIKLNAHGIKPLILGAGWDNDYLEDVASEIIGLGCVPVKTWINAVGRTTLPLAMAYMKNADCSIGIANGLPMLAPYLGTPTVMLWPVRGQSKVEAVFCPEFCYNWLPPKLRDENYKALAVGTFSVNDICDTIVNLVNKKEQTIENPA
jgi:hypothetical protein